MSPEELALVARDWAFSHGLVYRSASNLNEAVHAPFSLFPSPFPKAQFEGIVALQPLFNLLIDKLSRDDEFIRKVMKSLESDEFTMKLFDIYKQTRDKEDTIVLGIHRSDYMLHKESDGNDKFLQVEINTIASSFSSLSSVVSQLHRFMVDYASSEYSIGHIPTNSSLVDVPMALVKAHEAYGVAEAKILIIVQPKERNIFDQRWIEFKAFEFGKVPIIRMTLAEIAQKVELRNNQLFVYFDFYFYQSDGNLISVAYYRAGYTPNDYPTEEEWTARLLIEKSCAVKCPNIAYHLVGAKKVQQVLADPNVLKRFIADPIEFKALFDSFAGLYPLDQSDQGNRAFEAAMKNPENYVMKPQREGGGNNIYGKDIPAFLSGLKPEERNAYILMDLINVEPHDDFMVKNGEVTRSNHYVIGRVGEKVLVNQSAGFLVRTKAVGVNEGGVATGYSVLDSPTLV